MIDKSTFMVLLGELVRKVVLIYYAANGIYLIGMDHEKVFEQTKMQFEGPELLQPSQTAFL